MLTLFSKCPSQNTSPESIYDIEINNLTGEPINLNDYKEVNLQFENQVVAIKK